MSIAIKMPALSPTMEEGTLAKWLVKVGDKVSAGDVMAEIETDKATMEFEAVDEGTIADIAVPEGTEGVKVGTVIATLAEEGEDPKSVKPASGEAPAHNSTLSPAAPAMPPALNRPWKPDIMVRPLARSTITAWMFMATSTAPTAAPNASSAKASDSAVDAVASAGSSAQMPSPAMQITPRQPKRAARAPDSGMVRIEPIPRHSSSRPRVPSSVFSRCLA